MNMLNVPYYGPQPRPDTDLSLLDGVRYVILTKQSTEYFRSYAYGYIPGEQYLYDTWPQTETGQKADLIYNSGGYKIYENTGG